MSPLCARGELETPGQIVQGRTSYLSLMMLGDLPEGRMRDAGERRRGSSPLMRCSAMTAP